MFYFLSGILFFSVTLISYSLKCGLFSLVFFYIFSVIIKKNSFDDNKFLFNFIVLLIFMLFVLVFKNDNIIKLKTTFIYFCISLFFYFSYFYKKIIFRDFLFKYNFVLSDSILNSINLAFALFFFFLSMLNIYIALNYSTKFWLFFKTFGFSFLFILFIFFVYTCVVAKK